MKLDEVIEQLTAIRVQHGNLPVIVEDGLDPSDLGLVRYIELGSYRFFGDGTFVSVNEKAVRLGT